METSEQHTSTGSSELSSSRRPRGLTSLDLYEHDLPKEVSTYLQKQYSVAIDTETSGLDYRKDTLALVQLATQNGEVFMVRRPDPSSINLRHVFYSRAKHIFHHCLFDMRFILAGLNTQLSDFNVLCTKTLSKITHPENAAGLAANLRNMLDVHITKAEQQTNWLADNLTQEQLWYAAGDVLYLHDLHKVLYDDMRNAQGYIYRRAISALIHQAILQVWGYTDLLDYEKEEPEISLANRAWWTKLRIERENNNE